MTTHAVAVTVRPGDFGLCRSTGAGADLVGAAELADGIAEGDGGRSLDDSRYRHAFLVESVDTDGTVHAIEAWPGGVRRHTYRTDDPAVRWSSGVIEPTDTQRAAAIAWAAGHVGDAYSWLDYAAQAADHLHVPLLGTWLDHQVVKSGHLICSMFVCAAWQAAGVELFTPPRWCGDVAPSDLADRLDR